MTIYLLNINKNGNICNSHSIMDQNLYSQQGQPILPEYATGTGTYH
jgi:hypothetical protein